MCFWTVRPKFGAENGGADELAAARSNYVSSFKTRIPTDGEKPNQPHQ